MPPIPLHLLPPKLREIAEACGLDVALRLLEVYPGVELYVPLEQPGEDHPLVRGLGWDAAARLWETYRGDIIVMPRAARAFRALRNAQIREERRHLSRVEVALRHRMTDRMVSMICNASPESDDSQFDLFDPPSIT